MSGLPTHSTGDTFPLIIEFYGGSQEEPASQIENLMKDRLDVNAGAVRGGIR